MTRSRASQRKGRRRGPGCPMLIVNRRLRTAAPSALNILSAGGTWGRVHSSVRLIKRWTGACKNTYATDVSSFNARTLPKQKIAMEAARSPIRVVCFAASLWNSRDAFVIFRFCIRSRSNAAQQSRPSAKITQRTPTTNSAFESKRWAPHLGM